MNQILDYNPNKSSGGGSSGSDKVTRVFALILICFAICLVVAGAYNLINNKNNNNISSTEPSATQAKITVEKVDDGVVIKVSHDKVIKKLMYNWDSQKESTFDGKNSATMEETIPLLAGSHTLNIKVVDIDGAETVLQETIESETGEDQIFPVIDLKVTDDKKLKIIATDETEISYVTYRWNDEEEFRVDVSDEDKKKIEFEIDIRKGKNDVVIVAVDANNKSANRTESFTGVTKPDITVTISADKRSVDIKCYHENGIKEVGLNINNLDYQVDLQGETPTDVDLPGIELAEGDNTIKVTARSVDDTITEVIEEVVSDPIEDEINLSISDDGTIAVNVPNGIREMKLNLNDMDFDIDLLSENPTDITIDRINIPYVEGKNKLTVKVVGFNGTVKEETKELDYKAE